MNSRHRKTKAFFSPQMRVSLQLLDEKKKSHENTHHMEQQS
jgi:hypothetical protein